MRAALITTSLAAGGAERALLNLAQLLSGAGHRVELVLLENNGVHRPPPSLVVHHLYPNRVGHGWLAKRLAARRLRLLWQRLERDDGPFDLVVSTLPFCDEVVRLAGLPRVHYRIANTLSAEIELLARRHRAKAARREARNRTLYEGQSLIAVSEGVAVDLRSRIGLARATIARIYNPFDFDALRERAQAAESELPAQPYIIHVGRFAPQKRHDLLFEAYRRAQPQHRLVLLCQPSAQLNQLIAAHGLDGRVTVAGFRANPLPWIAGASLLVLSSDHEGMPNVLIEALAVGTPVVSTDCPSGPREILGPSSPALVPCGDPERLAQAIKVALADPRATERAQPPSLAEFQPAHVLGQYEALAAKERAGEKPAGPAGAGPARAEAR